MESMKNLLSPIFCVVSSLFALASSDEVLAWLALCVGVVLGLRSAADRLRDTDKQRYRRERDEAWAELDKLRLKLIECEDRCAALVHRLSDLGETSDLGLIPVTEPEQPDRGD
jgi:hypothetical protein